MGKKWLYWIVGGLAAALFGVYAPHSAAAATNQQAVPLRVAPVLNQYQATQAKSYFDLEMAPGQSTEMAFKLGNVSDQPIEVSVTVAAAATGDNAQIDYSGGNKHYDESLAYPMPTLVSIPKAYQHIKIPANQTATYHVPLKMPTAKLAGYLLGQINIRPTKTKAAKGAVTNTYSYGIGVRLSNGSTTLPALKSPGKATLTHSIVNTQVNATLQNPKQSALRNGKLEATVTKQGQNRVLKSVTFNSSTVAPNSRFTVKVPWTGAIAPGDYTMHMVYNSTDPSFDSAQTWKFTKNFHVSAIQAAQYTLANYRVPWWVYAIVIVILLLLIVIIILLLRRRKEAQTSEDQA
ncbi:DUF916 and DUF3324 domain-containing protein [Lacticaseibacillus jixiensis]|uniref:DUF916 and DUF3324 domain-containing protein n=1 Tax=Lacticaseibacillus jixiensis TaxID=3231926 RepID=UPI0036F1D0D4